MSKVDPNDLAASTSAEGFRKIVELASAQAKREAEKVEIGEEFDQDTAWDYDEENDPSNLLGRGWLRKGGSLLISGDPGTGKSSLGIQALIGWAFEKSFFGIQPRTRIHSAVIQAENDDAQNKKYFLGITPGLGLMPYKDEIKKMVHIYNRPDIVGGQQLYTLMKKMAQKHKGLDVILIDPLLSYCGGDVTNKNLAEFLYGHISKFMMETGIAVIMNHHNCKPSAEESMRSASDNYLGGVVIGAWARAMAYITKDSIDGRMTFSLGKNPQGAGLVDAQGKPALSIPVKHCPTQILWQRDMDPLPERYVSEPEQIRTAWLTATTANFDHIDSIADRMAGWNKWNKERTKLELKRIKSALDAFGIEEADGVVKRHGYLIKKEGTNILMMLRPKEEIKD